MTQHLVLCTVENGVATLTLNRPEKLNALTAEVFLQLRRHLATLATRADIRCLVLAGAGRSFCAGHDLAVVATAEATESRFAEAETIDELEAFPAPTIARIQGHCLTGGLELALACDLLVAADTAQLGDTHGRWGLIPVWGMSVRLPERVGVSRAKELSFTSRMVNGSAAEEMGLVDRCVPEADLGLTVADLATEISANSAGTNRIYKSLYAQCLRTPREAALRSERQMPFGVPEDAAELLAGR
ncbi:enoyl-CoA hydratase/isomerase family protein [Nocardia asteroides]|uniref:enoyl-CoA hydratase/isomerase family protein n=1 Tax=Nocardia asteroides TaxID=1824 RepID=UPI001E3E708A|nr:enoyl-CoA hydratase/isomerase family protein [Nocardia asteroides]UGT55152.1 enoyl-CoA hydratase/isomerase family protein [Nocardia asteroides]